MAASYSNLSSRLNISRADTINRKPQLATQKDANSANQLFANCATNGGKDRDSQTTKFRQKWLRVT
jgi:hypothetical protein